jgi:hypothetical protein
LACIEPTRVLGLDAPAELLGRSGVNGALVVLTGDISAADLDAFRARVQASGLEAQLAFTPTASAGPVVSGSVARLGPDTPLAAAWAALVSRRTTGATRRSR